MKISSVVVPTQFAENSSLNAFWSRFEKEFRRHRAVGRRARLGCFLENVVGAYDRRVRIGERIRDVLPVRETLEHPNRVVDSQNVNVSSSAIMMTGGPPDDILTAWVKVSLPPADAAHCWSASMDGK